jgi:flavodoxin
MRAMIVCTSVSHGNTARIAAAMGQVLDAPVVAPEDVDHAELAESDLVGFGSGIFNMDFHPQLRAFVAALPGNGRGAAFLFATSGFPEPPFRRYLRRFGRTLEQRGFEVAGTFSCRGFDTWLPLKLVGGVRKGHPDAVDLEAARRFAEGLRERAGR